MTGSQRSAPQHLIPALIALFLAVAALAGGVAHAHGVERRYIHALAPIQFPQKNQGTALQAEAFRQPDLLPIYGSSELNISNPYHGNELFKYYPTGFNLFPVGKAGTTSLVMLQDMAAVGRDLRGKKVAISLSAGWFFGSMAGPDSYAGNFSRLHALELIFSSYLSWDLKKETARRMLWYPRTFEKDPVLGLALRSLSVDKAYSRPVYYLLWPIAKTQAFILRLQDHWETIDYIRKQKRLDPNVKRIPGIRDWDGLRRMAEAEQKKNASNNPFGFDNNAWNTHLKKDLPRPNSRNDASFLRGLYQAKEFTDLGLLLRGLKQMGAEPLLLSMPIPGAYYDYLGISRAARETYYSSVAEIAKMNDVPYRLFDDHDEDKYFIIDSGAHLSRKGWVYYDQVLDAFYHGNLREQTGQGARPDRLLPGDHRWLVDPVRKR